MQAQEIQTLLSDTMPDAEVQVAGEGGKFMVKVISGDFAGLNAVKRQQSIYKILNPHISSGAIHAVSMDLAAPGEVRS